MNRRDFIVGSMTALASMCAIGSPVRSSKGAEKTIKEGAGMKTITIQSNCTNCLQVKEELETICANEGIANCLISLCGRNYRQNCILCGALLNSKIVNPLLRYRGGVITEALGMVDFDADVRVGDEYVLYMPAEEWTEDFA